MYRRTMWTLVALALASLAYGLPIRLHAQEAAATPPASPEAPHPESAPPESAPPEAPQGDNEAPWTASLSGGVTLFSGESDQRFVEMSLSRDLGDSWLNVSLAHVDPGGDAVSAGFVPARTRQIALSGGTAFGAVSVNAHVAFGERSFDDLEFMRRDGRPIMVESDGSSFGLGGSVTYDIAVGKSGFLSPSLAVDHAKIDVARAANVPGTGLFTIAEEEKGTSFTGSLAYQHLFGPDYAHNIGAYAAVVHSSNNALYNPGNSPQALVSLFALRGAPGQKDSWAEAGATGSFGLSGNLRLNVVALRTFGFSGPEATSLSAGIAISF